VTRLHSVLGRADLSARDGGRHDGRRLAHREDHGVSKITRLTPMQGVCAETAGSVMLFAATSPRHSVSTTHTITGSIIGVGAAKRLYGGALGGGQEIVTVLDSSPSRRRRSWPPCFIG